MHRVLIRLLWLFAVYAGAAVGQAQQDGKLRAQAVEAVAQAAENAAQGTKSGAQSGPKSGDHGTKSGAQSGASPREGNRKPLVLLISLDGFRADYLERGHAPTLQKLAAAGLQSAGMVPVFPTYTFPTHLSLVTGRHPGGHGIVNNMMRDPGTEQIFRLGAREAIENPFWWEEATPIWLSLKAQGKRSATLFWPGADVAIRGTRPDDWIPYEHGMTHERRIALLLEWLGRPDAQRADFATLYFSDVDSAGHASGPDSDAVNRAIARVDASLAALLEGLERMGLRKVTTLVIVADHGMRFVPIVNTLDGADLLEGFARARWVWFGPTSGLDLHGEDEAAVLKRLERQEKLRCWSRAQAPVRFGLGSHRRVPDIVCLAEEGYAVGQSRFRPGSLGQHGFDPADPQMHALLLVSGHRVEPKRMGKVHQLDVYPMLCALLGIDAEAYDGGDSLVKALALDPPGFRKRAR